MALSLKSRHPFTVTVNHELVHLSIKRMNPEEHAVFLAQFRAYNGGRKAPAAVEPSAIETPEAFEARLAAEAAYRRANARWITDTFDAYVSVDAGNLVVDDLAVTTGGDFARAMAGYGSIVSDVLAEIWAVNTLTAEQKKTLESLLASPTTSTAAPPEAGNGPAPAPAVTPAAPPSSVRSADATAPSNDASSGTTDRSSSGPAPSDS